MFDPEEIPQITQAIKKCSIQDRGLLDELRKEVCLMKPHVRVIKERSITSFSLVASDGTNNKLVYNPFSFQLIRIVDSNGKNLCLDTITPLTDTDYLSRRQFYENGDPLTPLGTLMKDLNCKTLHELSPMIPKGEIIRNNPDKVSSSWVLTYRDLCEWAVLYDKICYQGFTNNTIIIRDGLLRSKIFSYNRSAQKPLFIEMMSNIQKAIDDALKKRKIKIYFVGLAKHSQVLNRYSLAMQIEDILLPGEPRYAKVPLEMEEKSYVWKEYIAQNDEEGKEANKYSVGNLYLVRFGKRIGDPIWAIDLLATQTGSDAEIMGCIYMDTIDGFPIPHYPMCLQKALEYAQIVDFDLDILQDEVTRAVRDLLPDEKQEIMDINTFSNSTITNRQ